MTITFTLSQLAVGAQTGAIEIFPSVLLEEKSCLVPTPIIVRTAIIITLVIEAIVFDGWVEIRIVRMAINV